MIRPLGYRLCTWELHLYGNTTEGAAVKVHCAVVQSDLTYYADNRRYTLCGLAEALTSLIG